MANEIILLNRVRVDIGNVSGSLSELMQYATLKGFNDNYEPLEKPRLVGTWTINDWYISEQLTQARNTFDGLTIIENNEFLIDFNNLAVQTLDSTLPNYNPAVAIILHNNGIGNLLDFYYHETGGKYFLTKSEAAESRNMSNKFTRKVNIADTNLIVSNTNASYTFSSFDEMLYFTNTAFWLNNQNTEHGFMYCTELVSVTFPTNVTCLGSNLNTDSYGIFYGCSKLNFPISRLANITRIPGFSNEGWGTRLGCFGGCSSLNWETISSDDLPNLTYLGSGAFMGCTKIKHVTLNLSSLNKETFYGCSGLQDLSLPNATSIPAGFCANCTSLTTLSIPQCTYIGIYAFANCGSLTTINNSTHLDELYLTCNADVGTFVKCYSLKYYASTINKEIHTQEFGSVQFMNRDLIVTNSSFELSSNIKFGDCFTFQNRTNGIDTITFTNITQMCPLPFDRTSMTGNYIIRIDTNAPPTLNTTYNGAWDRYPIKTNVYVGNGTASHDEALIDAYSVATNWTELYNRGMLLPWYLHEHTPALQSYDSSAPNYYPALCICFEQAGYGRYITTNNKTKGWYMSDEEAASITDTGNILKDKLTVTDVNGICGTVGATYTLRSADLSSFTNIESIDLSGSTKMSNVTIAQNSPLSEYKLPTSKLVRDWKTSGGYIESNGTLWIDTRFDTKDDTLTFEIDLDTSVIGYAGSGREGTAAATSEIIINSTTLIGINWGTWSDGGVIKVNVTEGRHKIKIDKNSIVYIDDINRGSISTPNLYATTFTLFGRHLQNYDHYDGSTNRIYCFKTYKNDVLICELYPAIDGNGVACMYDYITNLFFYNQGFGELIVSDEVKQVSIPTNIIEYILSNNGKSFIDTGVYLDNPRVVCKFEYHNDYSVYYPDIFGQGNNSNSNFLLFRMNNELIVRVNGINNIASFNVVEGNVYDVDINLLRTIVNGNIIATYSRNLNITDRTQKMKMNIGPAASGSTNSKFYYFKLYDGDNLVREMYPAIDDNNVICMYDYISEQFFYNSGTGEFITDNNYIIPFSLSLVKLPNLNDYNWKITDGYIKFDSNSYIDTGVYLDNPRVVCKVKMFFDSSINYPNIFGQGNNNNSNFELYKNGGNIMLRVGGASDVSIIQNPNIIYNLDINTTRAIVNGETIEYYKPLIILDRLSTMRINRGPAASQSSKSEFYYFKLYDGDELVREMYPAVDKNGVACMYDYVTKLYFYNSGTGVLKVNGLVMHNNYSNFDIGLPQKINSFTFNNCPNIDSIKLLSKIASTQDTLLNTVNATIPNTTGSIEDLISIAALWNNQSGENSNLKIYGSYTVTDVHPTTAQCEAIGYNPNGATDTQTITKIDGLSVTIDRSSIMPDCALQTLDSTKEGYNLWACIILEQAGYGTYVDSNDKTRGWYMTKQEAALWTGDTTVFRGKQTVTDNNQITGSSSTYYGYNYSFDEFRYFTSVINLAGGSFRETNILGITLPQLLERIEGGNTFYVTRISSIVLPESLTFLGSYNFFDNRYLMNVTINSNVLTKIDDSCFSSCSHLTTITLKNTTPPTLGNYVFSNCSSLAHIYVPASAVSTYQSASGWSAYASIIEAIPSN